MVAKKFYVELRIFQLPTSMSMFANMLINHLEGSILFKYKKLYQSFALFFFPTVSIEKKIFQNFTHFYAMYISIMQFQIIFRSGVRLKSISGGYGDLQMVISQLGEVRTSLKAFVQVGGVPHVEWKFFSLVFCFIPN